MPLVAEAFSAGRLSYSEVRAASRSVGLINERKLVKYACSLTAAQLERVLRHVVMLESGRLEAERDRRVSLRINGDGTVKISATLPADEGASETFSRERFRTNHTVSSSQRTFH